MSLKKAFGDQKLLKSLIIAFAIPILGISIYLFTQKKGPTNSSLETPNIQNISQEDLEEEEKVEEASDFVLRIDSLDIEALVVTDVDPTDEEEYLRELLKGVVHMNNTALPGEKGNVFIYGHSSSIDTRKYGRIFTDIYKLEEGDIIDIYYDGTYYTYSVIEQKIVEETDLSVLKQDKDNEILSLMTCWPIDTDDQRLIVIAERVE